MIESVSWFPLGLYIIEKSIRQVVRARGGERSLLWLAPVFAMQHLSAFTQVAYYSAIVYVTYFVFRLARRQRELSEKGGDARRVPPAEGRMNFLLRTPLTWWFAGTLLIGVGLSGVHLIPTYELVTSSHRASGVSFDYASDYAYDMRDILTFIHPPANGLIGDATYRGRGIFWEDYGYVGLLTIVAALYALVGWKKNWYVRFFAVTVVVAYLLVIGNNTPVFGIAYNLVPGMKYFRFPTRFLFVVDFGLSVLGALGLARFGGRVYGNMRAGRGIPRGVMEGGFLALLVGDLLFFQLPQNPIIDARRWFAPPANARFLSEDHGIFRIFSPGASQAHTAAFTKAGGWRRSLDPYVEQREYIQINSNVLYGLSTPDGYIPLSPDYVVDLWGDMDRPGKIKQTASIQHGQFHATPAFGKAMDAFNVEYLILPWRVEGINLVLLKESAGVFMYRNPTVLPRVRMASVVRRAATPEKAQAILFGEEFDPSKEVILEDLTAAGMSRDTTASSVIVESYRLNEVRIRVNAGQPGYLVCADTYYPGWRALVDGKEAPILRANVCQRAVAVPAGEHAVRFTFEPPSFTMGWMCTLVSVAALSIVGLAKRKGGG